MYPRLDGFNLFGGHGLASDDTEHAAFTAWALQGSSSPLEFERRLRGAFRRWVLALPAGIGLATLKAGVKATLGLRHTGVWSAGNGPLMRAPLLAVACGDDVKSHIELSTRMTHTDPLALSAAWWIAVVTRFLLGRASWDEVCSAGGPLMDGIASEPEESTEEFACRRGWQGGVSGFVNHTAPVVVHAALRYRDTYAEAVRSVIRCGGDTDTTAAIVGGMVGARLGPDGLPAAWKDAYADRPYSLDYLRRLAEGTANRLPAYSACLARNLIFGPVLLGYGFRRLLPPY